jgi:hypothetical protein
MQDWFSAINDDKFPMPSSANLVEHLKVTQDYTKQYKQQVEFLYKNPVPYLEQLRELAKYATSDEKPLMIVFPHSAYTHCSWFKNLIHMCEIVSLEHVIFMNGFQDEFAQSYSSKIFNVFYQISRVRKLMLVSDEMFYDPYNYTKLFIRANIKTSNYVWIIRLKSLGVLCIRKPIDPNEFWTLLQKKGIQRDKQPVMDNIRISPAIQPEVFFYPDDETQSYAWILNDYPHVRIDDLDVTQDDSEQNLTFIDKFHKELERTVEEYSKEDTEIIMSCYKQNKSTLIKHLTGLRSYRWLGPKHYLDCLLKGGFAYARDPTVKLFKDLEISQTPYGMNVCLTEYKPLDRPVEQLVYLELWHKQGYLIFHYMASDIRTWLNRYHEPGWLINNSNPQYLERLLHYTHDALPDMYIVPINTIHHNGHAYTLGRISSDPQGVECGLKTLHVWLPDSYILIIEPQDQ